MDIKIEKLENIEKNANMLILGKRGAGKTSFIISLLKGKNYSQGNIFCLNCENDHYRNELSFLELNIYNKLTNETLNDIITKCSDSTFIVIEDAIAYNNIDLILNYLEMCKKHNITLIILAQTMGFSKGLSDTFDYVVVFKNTNQSIIKGIYNKIDTNLTFENFEKIINKLDNYIPLIYNKTDENVHYYKI